MKSVSFEANTEFLGRKRPHIEEVHKCCLCVMGYNYVHAHNIHCRILLVTVFPYIVQMPPVKSRRQLFGDEVNTVGGCSQKVLLCVPYNYVMSLFLSLLFTSMSI